MASAFAASYRPARGTIVADREAALRSALSRSGTLAAAAAGSGMLFGSAAYVRDLVPAGSTFDPAYRALTIEQCSLLFPGFGLGPDATRRSNESFDFKLADPIQTIAAANNMAFAGGHLVWHQTVPSWVSQTLNDRNAILQEMLLEVTAPISHFVGRAYYWTVVNEVVDPATRNVDSLRSSFWLKGIGPDYIPQAFVAARRADAKAVLLLNENKLESDEPYSLRKREAVLALLRSLRQSGIPIDGLGMQAHLTGERPTNQGSLHQFMTSVREMGLGVYVTELDVFDKGLPSNISVRDAAVATTLREFLDVALAHPGVPSINTWGLSDNHSWYNSDRTPAVLRRGDGLLSRGTLLDDHLVQKPAYDAVLGSLTAAARDTRHSAAQLPR